MGQKQTPRNQHGILGNVVTLQRLIAACLLSRLYAGECKGYLRGRRPKVRATSTSSALFVSRRFLIGAKSLQQSAARWLIVAFAKRPCASSKRQMWNGVAQIFDATLQLRCLACTRPRLDANATQQSELSRFLKRPKPASNV